MTIHNKSRSVRSGFMLVITSHTLNHTYNSLLPILYPPMISEFQLSYSLVGMLMMGYNLSGGAFQLLMGFLGRFVRRKILLGFGMIWQSVANSFIAASEFRARSRQPGSGWGGLQPSAPHGRIIYRREFSAEADWKGPRSKHSCSAVWELHYAIHRQSTPLKTGLEDNDPRLLDAWTCSRPCLHVYR